MWKLASNTTASTWNSDRDLSRIRSRQKTFSLMKNMTIKRNRTIELNYQLWKCRQKARKMLCSEKDLKHRGRRYIEPKEVFGQIKCNMNYTRSRHLEKNKILMGFFFLQYKSNMCKNEKTEDIDWLIKLSYDPCSRFFRCLERINQRNLQKITA